MLENLMEERWKIVKKRMVNSFQKFLEPLQIPFLLDESEIVISTNSSVDIKRGRYVLMEAMQSGLIEFNNDDVQRYIVDNISYVSDYIELEPNNVNEFIEELVSVAFNDMIDDYMNYENISLNCEYDWIAKELGSKLYNR